MNRLVISSTQNHTAPCKFFFILCYTRGGYETYTGQGRVLGHKASFAEFFALSRGDSAFFFLLCCVFCRPVYAATPEEIKAAYLYQFVKYITWPTKNAPQNEVVIYLLDAASLYPKLSQKAGTVVDGKRLVVKQASSPGEIGAVHLLFVGEGYSGAEKIINAFNPKGVLTIGETPGFAKKGGMIGFVIPEDTVQFEINWEEAKAQGLTISAKLLQLATVVTTER